MVVCLHQLLPYAVDVNILGGSVHTVNENAEALVVATKEIGLEVNASGCLVDIIQSDPFILSLNTANLLYRKSSSAKTSRWKRHRSGGQDKRDTCREHSCLNQFHTLRSGI
jgi:hypothetical protein